MFKKIGMTAVAAYLLTISSLYADSDYYGKIGLSYVGGKTVEGSDYGTREYGFDNGIGIQLAVGYDFEIMSIEGEYTYSTSDIESVELSDESTIVSVGGYQDIHSLMANALYHPLMGKKFSPYIGLGFGFSYVLYESANMDVKDSALTLASQFMLGASYEILDDIGLNMELRHKRMLSYDVSGMGTVNFDNYNELIFALIYRFTP